MSADTQLFDPASVPQTLAGLVSGYQWSRNGTGCSGAEVFHLQADNKPGLYLKVAPRTTDSTFGPERQRLAWLGEYLPVPQVVEHTVDERSEYLLLTEVAGYPSHRSEFHRTIPHLIELLATGLRTVHALPIQACPFDHRITSDIAEAQARMDAGLVDESDFDDSRRGRSATDLFQELLRIIPADEDLVVTHGDYCLPNIIINGDAIGGFIDVGRAGVGDRWRDLTLAARSITFNLGTKWVSEFFAAYGVEQVDQEKMTFFALLDEFF